MWLCGCPEGGLEVSEDVRQGKEPFLKRYPDILSSVMAKFRKLSVKLLRPRLPGEAQDDFVGGSVAQTPRPSVAVGTTTPAANGQPAQGASSAGNRKARRKQQQEERREGGGTPRTSKDRPSM